MKRFFCSFSMAMLIQNLAPPFACRRSLYTSSFLLPITIFPGKYRNVRKKLRVCRAMTEQTPAEGPSSPFVKEIQRLSAKESLLLAVSYCTFSISLFGFFSLSSSLKIWIWFLKVSIFSLFSCRNFKIRYLFSCRVRNF